MNDSTVAPPELADAIAGWLRDRMRDAGAERLVVGLSGGIDSAVVCGLCCRAASPTSVVAVIMPAQSNPQDAADAELVAATFGVEPVRVDLTPVVAAFLAAMPPALERAAGNEQVARMALANVKPRLRMTTLYYLANQCNGLVVGTGNKTEARLGYFTKYGDGGVDLLPIVDLYKREVRALARDLGVPQPIIDKAPSAGLWPGQTDEGELGATYDALDAVLAALEADQPDGHPTLRAEATRRERASAHKRGPIPAFRRTLAGANG